MPKLKAVNTVAGFFNRRGIVAERCTVCGTAVLGQLLFRIIIKIKRQYFHRRFTVRKPGKGSDKIHIRRGDHLRQVKPAVRSQAALYRLSRAYFFGFNARVARADVLHFGQSFFVPYPMFLTANSYALRQKIFSICSSLTPSRDSGSMIFIRSRTSSMPSGRSVPSRSQPRAR